MDLDRRRRHQMREGLIKFPVALQSTRAVVTTVLTLYCREIGNQIARSDLFATSTEAIMEEEDIVTASCSKKMVCLSHWRLQRVGGGITTQQVSFPSSPILSDTFLSLLPLQLRLML